MKHLVNSRDANITFAPALSGKTAVRKVAVDRTIGAVLFQGVLTGTRPSAGRFTKS